MAIRRGLMMGQKKVLDTTPIILENNARLATDGSVITTTDGRCITAIYDCHVTNNRRTFIHYGLSQSTINYKNGAYYDYWNNQSPNEIKTTVLAKDGTEQMQFTVVSNLIDDCYVIYENTGQILFAGKNSPYYGYTNINDMP